MKEPICEPEALYGFEKLRRMVREDILGKLNWWLLSGDRILKATFMIGYHLGRAVEAGEDIKEGLKDL